MYKRGRRKKANWLSTMFACFFQPPVLFTIGFNVPFNVFRFTKCLSEWKIEKTCISVLRLSYRKNICRLGLTLEEYWDSSFITASCNNLVFWTPQPATQLLSSVWWNQLKPQILCTGRTRLNSRVTLLSGVQWHCIFQSLSMTRLNKQARPHTTLKSQALHKFQIQWYKPHIYRSIDLMPIQRCY